MVLIPTPSGLAESDLETQLKTFAQDHTIGDWGIAVFDRTYNLNPGLNAVRASGIVLYFFRREVSLTQTISSSSYLYILGVNNQSLFTFSLTPQYRPNRYSMKSCL